jgi:hypothetical protein
MKKTDADLKTYAEKKRLLHISLLMKPSMLLKRLLMKALKEE